MKRKSICFDGTLTFLNKPLFLALCNRLFCVPLYPLSVQCVSNQGFKPGLRILLCSLTRAGFKFHEFHPNQHDVPLRLCAKELVVPTEQRLGMSSRADNQAAITNLGENKINHTIHNSNSVLQYEPVWLRYTLRPVCDRIHYDCEKMMFFPCDQSIQSNKRLHWSKISPRQLSYNYEKKIWHKITNKLCFICHLIVVPRCMF